MKCLSLIKLIGFVLKFAFSSFFQFAIKNRIRHRSKEFPKREHWLDWAKEKYDVSDHYRHSVPSDLLESEHPQLQFILLSLYGQDYYLYLRNLYQHIK